MGLWRRVALIGLVVFLALIIFHAVRPYGWTSQSIPPPGVASRNVTYTCGAPWGSGEVRAPEGGPYRFGGVPCGQRSDYQVMTAIDVLLGVFALAVLAGWGRVRSRSIA